MRQRLIHDALVLDPVETASRKASILIEGDTIRALLSPGERVGEDAERIDGSRSIVIPGLVNAHTHSHLTLAKGIQDRWTLELHLNGGLWTNGERPLEWKRAAATLGAAEMIAKGCTTCYDLTMEIPYPSREGLVAIAEGYRAAGMRVLLAPMLADLSFWQAIPGLLDALPADLRAQVDLPPAKGYESVLAELRALARAWPFGSDHAPLAIAPTIPLHCTDDYLRGCAALARDEGLRVQMHLGESKIQAIAGYARYGASLTTHVDRMGLLGPGFTGAHAVWLDDADFALMAERGAGIAHNPISNLRLGSGAARVRKMQRAGVRLGIGTDTSSCSDGLNMFEAVRTAALLAHGMSPEIDDWLGAADVFAMATTGSAALVGMDDRIGRIAPGYKADLVLLDRTHLNYVPLNDALRQLVYVEDGTAVRTVIVGGETVYRDGRHLGFDYERLTADVEAAAAAMREPGAGRRRLAEALEPHVRSFCTCLGRQPFHIDRYAAPFGDA